jgi:hypothetical protein
MIELEQAELRERGRAYRGAVREAEEHQHWRAAAHLGQMQGFAVLSCEHEVAHCARRIRHQCSGWRRGRRVNGDLRRCIGGRWSDHQQKTSQTHDEAGRESATTTYTGLAADLACFPIATG